jgi:hypothetical protein
MHTNQQKRSFVAIPSVEMLKGRARFLLEQHPNRQSLTAREKVQLKAILGLSDSVGVLDRKSYDARIKRIQGRIR